MHIAIEGMDGVGKSTQALELAKKLGGKYIPKLFHKMRQTNKKYDEYVLTQSISHEIISVKYGVRHEYFLNKRNEGVLISDRTYISDCWTCENFNLFLQYTQSVIGTPDLIVFLYAEFDVLYKRIISRNPKDKDLRKILMSDEAYNKMFRLIKIMKSRAIVIDNTHISLEESTDIILFAIKYGINACVKKYSKYCSEIKTNAEIVKNEMGKYEIVDEMLLSCENLCEQVIVPEKIKKVGEGAFSNCKSVEKLYISQNVKEIAVFAFLNASVESIEVSCQNLNFCSNDGVLYDRDSKILIKCPENYHEDLEINTGVVEVSNFAFHNCSRIERLVLPETIKKIGYGAFMNCDRLKEIVLGGHNLEELGVNAFYGCWCLEKIEIRNNSKFFVSNGCLRNEMGDILFFFGCLKRKVYTVPKCEYVYPYAYYNKLEVDTLIISQMKIGAHSFEKCRINKVIADNVEAFGENCFSQINLHSVQLEGENIPPIYRNSFDKQTRFIMKKEELVSNYSRGWEDYDICSIELKKNKELICGDACIEYIKYKERVVLPQNTNITCYWIMDIGILLYKLFKYNSIIYYNNSRLMKDYYRKSIPKGQSVLKRINKFLEQGGKIIEKKICLRELRHFYNIYKWVILCLRSDVLFGDETLRNNNHYVILDKLVEDGVYIITPGCEYIYRKIISSEKLMRAIENNGQWVICIENRNI